MICQKKICVILALLAELLIVIYIDKKNHLQVYLEECKYRVKKTQMSRFINTELKSDSESSDSDLDSEKVGSKFDKKLMTKLEKSDSD